MKHIVLSTDQKTGLENLRQAYTSQGGKFVNWADYQPIEIETKDVEGNPYYILPLSVLSDPALKAFNDYVMANKTTDLVIREVADEEYKVYEL